MSFWHGHKTAILKGSLKLVLLAVFALCILGLFSTKDYSVKGATLGLRLDLTNKPGQLVVSLGPAGWLKLKTHKVPIDIDVDYVLDEDQTEITAKLIDNIASIRPDVPQILRSFVLSRLVWILAIGALVGALMTNGGGKWRKRVLRNTALGVVASVVIFGSTAVLTALTADTTPAMEYYGVAKHFSEIARVVQEGDGSGEESSRSKDFFEGIKSTSIQMEAVRKKQEENGIIQILCVSDLHDDIIGAKLVRRITKSGEFGEISAVLLAGDITNYGSAAETTILTSELSANGFPVYFIGGNHEDESAMKALKRAGYQSLSEIEIFEGSLAILGQDDPVAWTSDIDILEREDVLTESAARLKAIWDDLLYKPQILLVHKKEQAADIVAEAEEADQKLAVVYGDDHQVGIARQGKVTLVDVGSSGASGYEQKGKDPDIPYTFQILGFSKEEVPELLSVTTLKFKELKGDPIIEYVPVD